MILGVLDGAAAIAWSTFIMVRASQYGPRSIASVIIGILAIIVAAMVFRSPKITGAILAILGVVGLFYFIPEFTLWLGIPLILAGVLAFAGGMSKSA
jgi:uncharacterized membrane protein (UPF0136 family)